MVRVGLTEGLGHTVLRLSLEEQNQITGRINAPIVWVIFGVFEASSGPLLYLYQYIQIEIIWLKQ